MLLMIVVALIVLTWGGRIARRRLSFGDREKGLGWMSGRWIAEYHAAHP